jgi:hypothetical protein
MKILILVITLLLQGCIVGVAAGTIAAEIEYDNYVKHTKAKGDTPMGFKEYFDWSNPQCAERVCDRSKLRNKDYRDEPSEDIQAINSMTIPTGLHGVVE